MNNFSFAILQLTEFILVFRQKIPVEMSGKMPMDMITYYRLFGMNRQPHEGVDVQTFSSDSKHIIVAHNKNVSHWNQLML